jgi:hypothetical protein
MMGHKGVSNPPVDPSRRQCKDRNGFLLLKRLTARMHLIRYRDIKIDLAPEGAGMEA